MTMKISSKARSALLAMVHLAKHKHHISLSTLADSENLSLMFLEQIFSKLKKADLVHSLRGTNGGYTLKKDPQDISVLDIIQAVDPLPNSTKCQNQGEPCKKTGEQCSTHHFWKQLDLIIFTYLNNTSLLQIISQNSNHSIYGVA